MRKTSAVSAEFCAAHGDDSIEVFDRGSVVILDVRGRPPVLRRGTVARSTYRIIRSALDRASLVH